VIWIVNCDFKGIREDRSGFFKRNAMLLLVEKILALVPINGAFSTARQAAVSIFVLKMVTRTSMLRNLLTHYLPQHMRQHLPPPRPVVTESIPHIQDMRYLPGSEFVGELHVLVE
jgi:hypothetical protein